MATKRKKAPTCPNCGGPIEVLGVGRPPKFCGDYCRKAWHQETKQNSRRKAADTVLMAAGILNGLARSQEAAAKRGTGTMTADEVQQLRNLAVLVQDQAAAVDPARLV